MEFMRLKLNWIFAHFEKARYNLVLMKALTIWIPQTEWVSKVIKFFLEWDAILISLNGQLVIAVHGSINIRYISDPVKSTSIYETALYQTPVIDNNWLRFDCIWSDCFAALYL